MWDAISLVGSGLTLIAFITAIFFAMYRAKLAHQTRRIQSAPNKDKLKAIEVAAEFISFDTSNQPPDSIERMILEQLKVRANRETRISYIFFSVAIMAFVVTVIYLIFSNQNSDENGDPLYNISGRWPDDDRNRFGGGDLYITQHGSSVSWTLTNLAAAHSFQGRYISPTHIKGIQTRTAGIDDNGCVTVSSLDVEVQNSDSFTYDIKDLSDKPCRGVSTAPRSKNIVRGIQ
ncbi:hypothetical protein [Zavarzinia sp. CC-PAN008]|uniref:hypothetical protein n=1 Tax=Zavarzinia sp. CC-PAN008 TaxID=3243332 RepID=UPI003F744804